MGTVIALMLAAAAAQPPAPARPPAGTGARVPVLATAVILRADTSSETGGKDALRRHVQRHSDGRVAIEFE